MKKILIIQNKRIGDVLIASVIANNFKRVYPDSEIHFMAYDFTLGVLEQNPNTKIALKVWNLPGEKKELRKKLELERTQKIINFLVDNGISKDRLSVAQETDFGDYTCEAYTFEQLPNALMEISFFREPVTLVKDLATAETQSGLVVYPNPAIDFIHIKTTRLDIEKVFIFDLSGKLIMAETSKDINISHLPTGNYVLSIKTYDGIKSFKVIKK